MVTPFVGSTLMLAVLGVLQLDTYPFSNILIIGFAVCGGGLLGKTVGAYGRTPVFLAILTAVSSLDVASFMTGVQNSPLPGNPSSQPVTMYANFTILLGTNSHFSLGSLDLLILSFAAIFFLMEGYGYWEVLAFSTVSLESPFLYVLALEPKDGLPLTPFITACAVALLLARGRRHRGQLLGGSAE